MFARKVLAGLAALGVLASGVAHAHHSVNAQFDVTKFVTIKGALTKVELINPHSYIHLAVAGENGAVENWDVETGTPAQLRRVGIDPREALKVGETYTIRVHPARNGSRVGLLNRLLLLDGREVLFGSEKSIQ